MSLLERLERFPLDDPAAGLTFTQRLARENGWSLGFAHRVVGEYRRFLYLAMTAGLEVTPSDEVDQAWHLHLTYTRSYWDELCRDVLGEPLHHGPTRGTRADAKRYPSQYKATLASYRATFGEDPPEDIWPSADERFDNPARFVRVDKHRSWVIPKPWHILAPPRFTIGKGVAMSAIPVLGLAVINPLDLPGKEFLSLYIPLAIGSVFAAALLRYFLRQGDTPTISVDDPYETACLAGGPERTVQAAVVSLVKAKLLKVSRKGSKGRDHNDYRLRRTGKSPQETTELEQRILDTCAGSEGARFSQVIDYARPEAEKIRHRLATGGLMLPGDVVPASYWVPLGLVTATILFGFAKFAIGLERDRPIGYLFVLLLVMMVALVCFLPRPLRTWGGDRELARLKKRHQHLGNKFGRDAADRQTTDWALAAGLFGLTAVTGTEAMHLVDAWQYRNGPSSGNSGGGCGSGDGGGGCGGGGCGGGCGGCGG